MLFVVVPSSFLCSGQQIRRWFKRWLFVGHFDSKQKGQRTVHLERCCRNAVLFFLMRDTTLSSPAFECGRIRTVLATSFIQPNLWVPFPSFNDDRYPQITSIRKRGWWFLIIFLTCKLYSGFIPDFLEKKRGANSVDNMHEPQGGYSKYTWRGGGATYFFGLKIYTLGIFLGQEICHVFF